MKKVLVALMLVLPMSVFAQKFGHFNMTDIAQAMPEFAAGRQELEAKSKVYQDELQRMQDEFKVKLEDYQKNAESLPDAIKERREQELTDLQQKMQDYVDKSRQDLAQFEAQKMKEIQEKLLKAVEDVGQAGGYVYIFDVASIPYVSKTLSVDVTNDVKTKLGIR